MDFSKYKSRLVDFLATQGHNVQSGVNIKCFLPTHTGEEKNPSLKIYGDTFKCFGCNQTGDVYDMAGLLYHTDDKSEQFEIVEKALGGYSFDEKTFVSDKNIVKEKPEIDPEAAIIVTNYMREQAKKHEKNLLKFAEVRGYGKEFSRRFGWWPGLKKATEDLGIDVIKKAQIPTPTGDGKKGTSWKAYGAVTKFKQGWKLFYVNRDGKTIKRASYCARTFPFPANIKKCDEIVLVEAEISSIACNLSGIPTLATGGTCGINDKSAKELAKYKTVIFCFDADEAGQKNSEEGARKLVKGGYSGVIKIARLEIKKEIGNDPDDYIKKGHESELKEYIKNAETWNESEQEQVEDIKEIENKLPFQFLGFSEGYHFFIDRRDMILKTPIGKMTSGQLLEIAPLSFWKDLRSESSGKPDWLFISDLIIEGSRRVGPYKKSMVRGAGVWYDNNEAIVSDGEIIYTKDGKYNIRDYKSKNNYIRRSPIGIKSVKNEHEKTDCSLIKDLCNELSFATEQDGKLLFGWVVASIFQSCLDWKPIAYMKGPSSVGKSWVMNHVVRMILAEIAVCPSKDSTVIGVMQAPGCNSQMTIVDELEKGSDKRSQNLVAGLMNIARNTTTKNQESRYVGTQDQEGMSNHYSSMFLFASIVESSDEDQDVNRITGINMAKKANQNWNEIEAKVDGAFKDDLIGNRIRYDIIYHRDSILKNIKTFKKAARTLVTVMRNSDQIGTLVGGWVYFESPGKIYSSEEALDVLKKVDFTEQEERGKQETLKYSLSNILTAKIRYEDEELDAYGKESIMKREKTVYEILLDIKENNDQYRKKMNNVLQAYGLRFGTNKNPDFLAIAQGHEKIRNMFPREWAYRGNYHDYLKNHPDYRGKEKSVRFSGTVHQAQLFEIDFSDDIDNNDKIPF